METSPATGRSGSGVKRWLLLSGVALALALASAAIWLYTELHRPYAGFTNEVFVEIRRGETSRGIAATLARRGVIADERLFLAARLLRTGEVLQAGEYRFAQPASVWSVFDRFVRGDVYYHAITIPEGSNRFETARILARLDWIGEAAALAATASTEQISDLDPEAETLEGYLFPSTYHVTRGTSPAEVCRMMTREFRRIWARAGGETDVRETVILASLVEKETGVPDERRLVASVFHNRLRRDMRLECDPTVIYAAILEERYDGVIRRSDLDNPHPYNTYRHAGLPPGPIASPGRAAIEATLNPASTEYVFFVAAPDRSGRHVFSESLSAHNRAVARYRRALREAVRQGEGRRASEAASPGENN